MVLNKNLTKIGLLLLIIFIAVQSYSQKCWYDYHMKDPITDNEIKGITFNVGGFLDSRWQLELHKHGNQYFIGMYIKLNGNIREVITPENTIVFKLENGEIITIHANEDYVPTSQATQYGIVSWFNARYVIPEDDMQKIAASQLTYIRASVGTQVYGGSISKKKGKLFQSNAKCILL